MKMKNVKPQIIARVYLSFSALWINNFNNFDNNKYPKILTDKESLECIGGNFSRSSLLTINIPQQIKI